MACACVYVADVWYVLVRMLLVACACVLLLASVVINKLHVNIVVL